MQAIHKFTLATALLAGSVSPLVAQDVRAILLLDRSGSMLTGTRVAQSEDDLRRCAEQIFADYGGGGSVQILVRSFRTSGGVTILSDHGWHGAMSGVDASIASVAPVVGADSTPLAEAVCTTASDLAALSTDICVVGIFTDGGENSSVGECGLPWDDNATGACPRDPDVATAGPFVGFADGTGAVQESWQQAVCAALEGVSHAPRPPLPPFFPASRLIVRNYFYGDFGPPAGAPGTGFGGGGAGSGRASVALAPSLHALRSIARAGGGSTVLVDDVYGPRFREFRSDPWGACLNAAGHMQQLHVVRGGKLGEELLVQLPGAQSPVVFLGFRVFTTPLSLDVVGAPLCGLAVNPVLVSSFEGRWNFPASQGLVGVRAHVQGLDWDGINTPVMTPRWTWDLLPRVAPSVAITSPVQDLVACEPGTAWDGYDATVGKWYKDVTLSASIVDNEIVPGANVEWTTDRTDVQAGLLGTGNHITVRFYGDCFGTLHTITVRVTDQEGHVVTRTRRMLFWTLC